MAGRSVGQYGVAGRRMLGHIEKGGAIVGLEVGAQPAKVGLALRICRETIQLENEGVRAQNQQRTGGVTGSRANPGAETTGSNQFTHTIGKVKEGPDG